jgi:membrane fusion protein, multidrug efflux system
MKRLLVPLLLAVAGCSRDGAPKPPASAGVSEPVPVDVSAVTEVRMDRTLPIVGTLFAKDSATIAAEVEGRVEKTMSEFGDRVKEGQELALVDTDTYAALASLAGARIQQAKAAELAAGQELRRQDELRKSGIASSSDHDSAVAAADEAHAAVKAAEANEVVARLNLERSRIRAPFDGAVADRIASAGDFVKSGAPLYRLVNDAVLKFIVQAPESFAPQVVKGLPVVFSVDAYPGRQFEGRVFLVSPQVNLATRMFDFGALVPNADRVLKAGTFARGELILERAVPTLTVPVESLVVGSGVSRVFVVTNDLAVSRVVRPGRIADGRQEILSGLGAGEKVVTSGQGKLTEGSAVRVKR